MESPPGKGESVWLAYVMVFLVFLLWLELRDAPRWSVWFTFMALASPAFAYGSACLNISNKVIVFTTTGG